VRSRFVAAALVIAFGSSRALAEDAKPTDAQILGPEDTALRIESITTRITGYNQYGFGYQSKAGPIGGPGSERLLVFEPQVEVVATQGDRVTHRIWVPIDVVTAASPHSFEPTPDVVSGASRKLEGGTFQWSTTYKADRGSQVALTSGLHIENPFRSWNAGLSGSRALADQNTVVAGSVVGILDWFDRFLITGVRNGRAERSTTMASAGVTQVLTPTTIVHVNYGLTVQEGELGNTWNVVPLANGERGAELLPSSRTRHALVGRMSQFLPWNGALRLYYRFYTDDWGIEAHSVEGPDHATPDAYALSRRSLPLSHADRAIFLHHSRAPRRHAPRRRQRPCPASVSHPWRQARRGRARAGFGAAPTLRGRVRSLLSLERLANGRRIVRPRPALLK
jgi:hypothetical protein